MTSVFYIFVLPDTIIISFAPYISVFQLKTLSFLYKTKMNISAKGN